VWILRSLRARLRPRLGKRLFVASENFNWLGLTGGGSIVEFRSVVDAVRCAIEVQEAMVERNAGPTR
jgi:class 3 adenylate cyclase